MLSIPAGYVQWRWWENKFFFPEYEQFLMALFKHTTVKKLGSLTYLCIGLLCKQLHVILLCSKTLLVGANLDGMALTCVGRCLEDLFEGDFREYQVQLTAIITEVKCFKIIKHFKNKNNFWAQLCLFVLNHENKQSIMVYVPNRMWHIWNSLCDFKFDIGYLLEVYFQLLEPLRSLFHKIVNEINIEMRQ